MPDYLGYSYVTEHPSREWLSNSLEGDVAQANMGYIIDSLGWLYFKLGQYDKAAVELEKQNKFNPG